MYEDLKKRMTDELNNHADRYNELKSKFDEATIELRHTEDKLKEQNIVNDELNNKFRVASDEIKNEINLLRDEGERRRQQIESSIRENKALDEKLIHLTSERRALEADLHSLTKKHEYTVNDYSNTIQRLEEDNMNLLKQKEDLDSKLNQKQNDLRTLN